MSDTESAVKLDNGKRKLSLIHPVMLEQLLSSKTPQGMHISMAMMSVSRAAHAGNKDELVAHLEAAISHIIKYCGSGRSAIELTAIAMEYGANKPEYGRNNWKKGMEWSRLADAALRHGLDIVEGEEVDKDSGNPHIAHMLASIHMLLGSYDLETGTNDLY